MNTSDSGLILTIADKFGVSALLILIGVLGLWKASPRVAAFLTSITEELRAMTRALGAMSERSVEHHAIVVTKIDNVAERLAATEARIKEHGQALAGSIGREVRDSATKTGEHVAITTEQALRELGRQPTNPDLEYGERPSPTPAGIVRPIIGGRLPRPPSQPGTGAPTGSSRQRGPQ